MTTGFLADVAGCLCPLIDLVVETFDGHTFPFPSNRCSLRMADCTAPAAV